MRSSTVASAFAVSLFSLMSAACGGGGGGSSVVPAAPAQVTLTPGSRSLTVAWQPVAGATEYNVYVASVPGVTDTNYGMLPEGAHAPATPHLAVTFDGLVEGGTYFVIVEAKSAAGTGPHSGELQATLRPGTPGAPVMQPGIAVMDVTWSGVLGAASYDLYLGTEAGLTSTSAGGVHYPGVVPPFHMTGLENGKTYFALITATNAAGTSLDSPVASAAPSGRGTFAEIPGLTGVTGLKDSVSGLFDADTYVDFAVVNSADSNVTVYLGDGDGTFESVTSYPTGLQPFAVIAKDLNADGFLDLVTANKGDGSVSVLLGDGLGGFAPRVDYPVGTSACSVAAASLSAFLDDTVDLVVADDVSGTVVFLQGNGDGTFGAPVATAAGNGPCFVSTGDFNGDGFVDAISVSSVDGTVSALLGDGMGAFPVRLDSVTGVGPTSLEVAKIDADNVLDLAVTLGVGGTMATLHGNGDGTFTLVGNPTATGTQAQALIGGDFNGDGLIDFAVANEGAGTVSVLLGDGNGTFVPFFEVPTDVGPVCLVTCDLNGDGILDLMVTNGVSGTVTVFLGATK